MMYFLYDIVVAIVLVLSIPVYLYRAIFRKKIRRGIRERFGFICRDKVKAVAGFDVIWVHAVSVGETMAARPLLKALRAQYPQSKIVLSQVTETGRAVAEKLPEADVCVYLPFDIRFSVKRAVSALHPKLVVVVETEIWPNFFKAVRRSGAAIVIANARISDRSFPRYRRFRRLLAPVLADVSYFCAQSAVDAERLVAMGADAGAVAPLGNLKYDVPTQSAAPERVSLLRKKYHLDDKVPVIVAASTHAGEEAQFLEVARGLIDEGDAFLTIVVPRHPERASEVVETARKHRFNPVLRSRLSESSAVLGIGDILIVDTIGELMDIYPTAHVVFMGGSLVPVGGHNILEPASVGKPVIFGPHMHNFRDIGNLALKTGAGRQVSSVEEFGRLLSSLLAEPERAEAAGAAALAMVAENGGATRRHMEVLRKAMEGR